MVKLAGLISGADASTGEVIAWWFIRVVWEQKFVTMFSLLFGMGMAVQLFRARVAGRSFAGVYLRRLAVLAVFGLAHGLLLRNGDILFLYACRGVGLLIFSPCSGRDLEFAGGRAYNHRGGHSQLALGDRRSDADCYIPAPCWIPSGGMPMPIRDLHLKRSRRVITIVLVSIAAIIGICGILFWLWYSWITTPPRRIAATQPAGSTIEGPRMAAEWEPATGVLIAWPFHLPRELVVVLASDVQLHITVKDDINRQQAACTLTTWGVPPEAYTFIVTPQGDGWYGTRDWGPFAVFDASGDCHLTDAHYIDYPVSGPGSDDTIYWLTKIEDLDFRPDDQAPAAVAEALHLRRIELPFALTGGAVATDGHGTAFITESVIRENEALGVPKDQFFEAAEAMLGIERFIVVPNYEELGVHHIDCLLALLDAERILVKRPPRDHQQYIHVESVVEVLSQQLTPSGKPYDILRVDTPRYADDWLANYTNALILNQKVYVPLFGIDADEQALETWRRAMPGYQVLGFDFEGEDGWTYTDALHCRIKAIWEANVEQ